MERIEALRLKTVVDLAWRLAKLALVNDTESGHGHVRIHMLHGARKTWHRHLGETGKRKVCINNHEFFTYAWVQE